MTTANERKTNMQPGTERMIVAATPNKLEVDDRMSILPPNLRVMEWFSVGANQRPNVDDVFLRLFDQNSMFENVTLNKKNRSEGGRFAENVDLVPWYGFHSLVKSLGEVAASDVSFSDLKPRFLTLGTKMPKKGPMEFATLSLFSVQPDGPQHIKVDQTIQLGAERDQAAS